MSPKFELRFANNIIEHLGVKLYQNQTTKVVAEYVSNGYDADAEHIDVNVDSADDPQYIVITDDGSGMSPEELSERFLVIGLNRRSKATDLTKKGRKPMGRKGIGKLAGFGIAREMDVLTATRNQEGRIHFSWIRFILDDILDQSKSNNAVAYEPEVIGNDLDIDELASAIVKAELPEGTVDKFKENLEKNNTGTCIVLHKLNLNRKPSLERLKNSLSGRFAMQQLNKHHVVLNFNGEKLQGMEKFLPLQEFSIGTAEALEEDAVEINGQQKRIYYWVGFIDLTKKNVDWPVEKAGVAVYAHNKLAQERPFFFGVKGKEILSRYMVANIFVDWLDEFSSDMSSTDRSSINWQATETKPLWEWGEKQVSKWLKLYGEFRKSKLDEEIVQVINKVPAYSQISGPETDAIKSLLKDIFPALEDNVAKKERACEVMLDAWVRQPMRIEIQELWKSFGKLEVNPGLVVDTFVGIVDGLRARLVPEMLDVAVTVSQRLYAIRQMKSILDPEWECLTKNQTLKTVASMVDGKVSEISVKELNDRPDFVFLSDATESQIIVVELKSPEHESAVGVKEYRQLHDYVSNIATAKPEAKVVQGILIVQTDPKLSENVASAKNISIRTWDSVLKATAARYEELLKSFVVSSKMHSGERHFDLIEKFGGKELGRRLEVLIEKNT